MYRVISSINLSSGWGLGLGGSLAVHGAVLAAALGGWVNFSPPTAVEPVIQVALIAESVPAAMPAPKPVTIAPGPVIESVAWEPPDKNLPVEPLLIPTEPKPVVLVTQTDLAELMANPPKDAPKPPVALAGITPSRKPAVPPITQSVAPVQSPVPVQNAVISPSRSGSVSAGKVDNRTVSYALGSPANPLPRYPRLARSRGWEGLVVLHVAVNAAGRPDRIDVRESSGHGLLDKTAVKTVRQWQFTPAERNGIQVAGLARVPIRFKLVD